MQCGNPLRRSQAICRRMYACPLTFQLLFFFVFALVVMPPSLFRQTVTSRHHVTILFVDGALVIKDRTFSDGVQLILDNDTSITISNCHFTMAPSSPRSSSLYVNLTAISEKLLLFSSNLSSSGSTPLIQITIEGNTFDAGSALWISGSDAEGSALSISDRERLFNSSVFFERMLLKKKDGISISILSNTLSNAPLIWNQIQFFDPPLISSSSSSAANVILPLLSIQIFNNTIDIQGQLSKPLPSQTGVSWVDTDFKYDMGMLLRHVVLTGSSQDSMEGSSIVMSSRLQIQNNTISCDVSVTSDTECTGIYFLDGIILQTSSIMTTPSVTSMAALVVEGNIITAKTKTNFAASAIRVAGDIFLYSSSSSGVAPGASQFVLQENMLTCISVNARAYGMYFSSSSSSNNAIQVKSASLFRIKSNQMTLMSSSAVAAGMLYDNGPLILQDAFSLHEVVANKIQMTASTGRSISFSYSMNVMKGARWRIQRNTFLNSGSNLYVLQFDETFLIDGGNFFFQENSVSYSTRSGQGWIYFSSSSSSSYPGQFILSNWTFADNDYTSSVSGESWIQSAMSMPSSPISFSSSSTGISAAGVFLVRCNSYNGIVISDYATPAAIFPTSLVTNITASILGENCTNCRVEIDCNAIIVTAQGGGVDFYHVVSGIAPHQCQCGVENWSVPLTTLAATTTTAASSSDNPNASSIATTTVEASSVSPSTVNGTASMSSTPLLSTVTTLLASTPPLTLDPFPTPPLNFTHYCNMTPVISFMLRSLDSRTDLPVPRDASLHPGAIYDFSIRDYRTLFSLRITEETSWIAFRDSKELSNISMNFIPSVARDSNGRVEEPTTSAIRPFEKLYHYYTQNWLTINDNKEAILNFAPVKNYDDFKDETVRVGLPPHLFTCNPENQTLYLEFQILSTFHPVLADSSRTAVSIMAVTSFVGLGGAGITAATDIQMLIVYSQMSCVRAGEQRVGRNLWMVAPYASNGDSFKKIAFSNLVILFGCLFLHSFITKVFVSIQKGKKMKHFTERYEENRQKILDDIELLTKQKKEREEEAEEQKKNGADKKKNKKKKKGEESKTLSIFSAADNNDPIPSKPAPLDEAAIEKEAVTDLTARMRFPSGSLLVGMILFQGITWASMHMVLNPETGSDILLGLMFLAAGLFFVILNVIIEKKFCSDLRFEEYNVLQNHRDAQTWKFKVLMFILPVGVWVPKQGRRMYGSLMAHLRVQGHQRTIWSTFPIVTSFLVSMVAAAIASQVATCIAQHTLLSIFYFVAGVLNAYYKPNRSTLHVFLTTLSYFGLSAIFAASAFASRDPRDDSGNMIIGLGLIFECVLAFVRVVTGFGMLLLEKKWLRPLQRGDGPKKKNKEDKSKSLMSAEDDKEEPLLKNVPQEEAEKEKEMKKKKESSDSSSDDSSSFFQSETSDDDEEDGKNKKKEEHHKKKKQKKEKKQKKPQKRKSRRPQDASSTESISSEEEGRLQKRKDKFQARNNNNAVLSKLQQDDSKEIGGLRKKESSHTEIIREEKQQAPVGRKRESSEEEEENSREEHFEGQSGHFSKRWSRRHEEEEEEEGTKNKKKKAKSNKEEKTQEEGKDVAAINDVLQKTNGKEEVKQPQVQKEANRVDNVALSNEVGNTNRSVPEESRAMTMLYEDPNHPHPYTNTSSSSVVPNNFQQHVQQRQQHSVSAPVMMASNSLPLPSAVPTTGEPSLPSHQPQMPTSGGNSSNVMVLMPDGSLQPLPYQQQPMPQLQAPQWTGNPPTAAPQPVMDSTFNNPQEPAFYPTAPTQAQPAFSLQPQIVNPAQQPFAAPYSNDHERFASNIAPARLMPSLSTAVDLASIQPQPNAASGFPYLQSGQVVPAEVVQQSQPGAPQLVASYSLPQAVHETQPPYSVNVPPQPQFQVPLTVPSPAYPAHEEQYAPVQQPAAPTFNINGSPQPQTAVVPNPANVYAAPQLVVPTLQEQNFPPVAPFAAPQPQPPMFPTQCNPQQAQPSLPPTQQPPLAQPSFQPPVQSMQPPPSQPSLPQVHAQQPVQSPYAQQPAFQSQIHQPVPHETSVQSIVQATMESVQHAAQQYSYMPQAEDPRQYQSSMQPVPSPVQQQPVFTAPTLQPQPVHQLTPSSSYYYNNQYLAPPSTVPPTLYHPSQMSQAPNMSVTPPQTLQQPMAPSHAQQQAVLMSTPPQPAQNVTAPNPLTKESISQRSQIGHSSVLPTNYGAEPTRGDGFDGLPMKIGENQVKIVQPSYVVHPSEKTTNPNPLSVLSVPELADGPWATNGGAPAHLVEDPLFPGAKEVVHRNLKSPPVGAAESNNEKPPPDVLHGGGLKSAYHQYPLPSTLIPQHLEVLQPYDLSVHDLPEHVKRAQEYRELQEKTAAAVARRKRWMQKGTGQRTEIGWDFIDALDVEMKEKEKGKKESKQSQSSSSHEGEKITKPSSEGLSYNIADRNLAEKMNERRNQEVPLPSHYRSAAAQPNINDEDFEKFL